jgi:UDP-glucose 4-epimerase
MTTFDGCRALVTGGAGFIGSHLVDTLLDAGAERVAVVDTFFLGRDCNLADAVQRHPGAVTVYREDAADSGAMAEICDRERPDIVFNLATKALLYSFFNPSGACRVNLDIALTLAELLRRGAYGRLVHVSSSEVYGSAVRVPMAEDHPLLAETTYAAGKAAADLAISSYVRMFGIDAVVVRPFNTFGPRQNDGDLAAVVPRTIRRVLAGEPPVIEGDGHQTRDFTYVRDVASAIVRLARHEGTSGSVFNVGSGRETPIEEIITALASLLGYAGEVVRRPARPADVLRHCADVRKAEELIGPIATTPLIDGLEATVAWFRERCGA